MQVLDHWSDDIARASGIDREIILYGLKLLFSNLAGFLTIVVAASAAGCLPRALAAYVASGSMRVFAGGRHTASPVTCAVSSAALFTGIGLLSIPVWRAVKTHVFYVIPAVALVMLVSLAAWAPVDTPNKPIRVERKKKLKVLAFLILFGWTCFLLLAAGGVVSLAGSYISAFLMGILAEGINLLPFRFRRQNT